MLSVISPSRVVSLSLKKSRHLLRHQAVFGRTALVMATLLTASAAFGAQVEPGDYARLLEEANTTGIVRILVTIDDSLTLEAIKKNPAAVRAAMEQQAKPLLAELGQDALEAGYWNNGLGQVGLYVTPNGLKIS
jgi:hypothetical protein